MDSPPHKIIPKVNAAPTKKKSFISYRPVDIERVRRQLNFEALEISGSEPRVPSLQAKNIIGNTDNTKNQDMLNEDQN